MRIRGGSLSLALGTSRHVAELTGQAVKTLHPGHSGKWAGLAR